MEFLQFLFCVFSWKLLPGLSESLDLNLISMRLDSGPRDEDTSWRSEKRSIILYFLTQNVWYNKIILITLQCE